MLQSDCLDHYQIQRRPDGSLWELGRGGMGVTYKAFDTDLQGVVALKVIHPGILGSPEALKRFQREARSAWSLRHPNIATVFRLGHASDGTDYYSMEYCEGPTAQEAVQKDGPLSVAMALRITLQVSRALQLAESRKVVHRDLKPSNLILSEREDEGLVVKVIDFGLAKSFAEKGSSWESQSGGFAGTAAFASPEQLAEQNIDHRSDFYSLGVTLWHLLTGRVPFEGSLVTVIEKKLHADPPWDSLEMLPPPVVTLLKRMLARDRQARPQSAAILRGEIEACMQACSVAGEAVTSVHGPNAGGFKAPDLVVASPAGGRTKRRALSLALILLLAAAGTGYFLVLHPRTTLQEGAGNPSRHGEGLPGSAPAQPGAAAQPTPHPQREFTNTLGMKFVSIPGTDVLFCIHETRSKDFGVFMNDPDHEEVAPGEEGNDWKSCEVKGKPSGRAAGEQAAESSHPVCAVSWYDATAFCRWLSRKESRKYRLPTDREWSVAVGIPQEPMGRPRDLEGKLNEIYPWGGKFAPEEIVGNYADVTSGLAFRVEGYKDGYPTTAPAMSFRANPNGLHDMGGNVWEWCEDWYDDQEASRVLRGGSWGSESPEIMLSWSRGYIRPAERRADFGFRVILDEE